MRQEVSFTVWGEPAAKGRPHFTKKGFAYTPEKTREYEDKIAWSHASECAGQFLKGPLGILMIFYISIPKSTSKKMRQRMIDGYERPEKRPDNDNLIKCICDGLNGIAYRDDAQISDTVVRRFYSESPRTEVNIWELAEQPPTEIILIDYNGWEKRV